MTKEELERDCRKFEKYLKAHGVEVLAYIICTDAFILKAGTPEVIDEVVLCIQADRLGYEVAHKSKKGVT